LLHLSLDVIARHLIGGCCFPAAIYHNPISFFSFLFIHTHLKNDEFFLWTTTKTIFFLLFLQIHDALEHDNEDIDSSGSGYGDDEDDIHTNKEKESRVNKDQTSNTHHSGDGSDGHVDSENNEDDDDDYIENHEDSREPLPIDGEEDDKFYFDNSSTSPPSTTSTSSVDKITPTDDEDSQFTFLFRLLFYF
jgi:hypothetical protein